jgi:hypothetical protein
VEIDMKTSKGWAELELVKAESENQTDAAVIFLP